MLLKNLGIALIFFLANQALVKGQIAPDNSLGNERSQVTTNNRTSEIRGGATRGDNLFHSFKEFSIPQGRAAYFIPQGNIANIFTRVTGRNLSQINGILGVQGQANLFLLNPQGIIFGKNARLDLKGSFIGTTGESFIFPDGSKFSASDPGVPPLLTVNVAAPIGIKFGNQPAKIVNQGSLTVEPTQTLGLIGGEINFIEGDVSAPGGKIALGAVASNNTITFAPLTGVSYQGVNNFEDILLSGGAKVYVNGVGEIDIHGKNISVTEGAKVYANNSGNKPGGDIRVTATGAIAVDGIDSTIHTQTFGDGTSGNVIIQGEKLNISATAEVYTATAGTGKGGDLLINISDSVEVYDYIDEDNFSILGAIVFPGVFGAGGNTTVHTKTLKIFNGGKILTGTLGAADAGDLQITATEQVKITGVGIDFQGDSNPSGILGGVLVPEATGKGGNVIINTKKLIVSEGGGIFTATFGVGDAGNLQIKATEQVEITGYGFDLQGNSTSSQLITGVLTSDATGNGGDLSIETRKLIVSNGGIIGTATEGQGAAGNIKITATDEVEITGVGFNGQGDIVNTSLLLAGVIEQATGKGGNITIETSKLIISQGGIISTATFGFGDGGDVNITAVDSVEVKSVAINVQGSINNSSSILTGVIVPEATGKGGNLNIETGKLVILDGGLITTATQGFGNAGDVKIQARDYVQLKGQGFDFLGNSNPSELSAGVRAFAVGDGGNITLHTPKLNVDSGATITTATLGIGNAGNLQISAFDSVEVQGGFDRRGNPTTASILSGVLSPFATGNAGNLTIDTSNLVVSDGGEITAATFGFGNAGNVEITATEQVEVNNSLIGAGVNFSEATPGSVIINTPNVVVTDRGLINVGNSGSGNAGSIFINSDTVSLDNQGVIVGDSRTGNGGNINLSLSNLLLLRRASNISTEAGDPQSGGSGGNININTQFIVAFPDENSDIIGNAFVGSGGAVTISARNIFGIQPRLDFVNTPFSDILSSSGIVINNLEINPNVSPVETLPLPVNIRFAGFCEVELESQTFNFYNSGRGGTIPAPEEFLKFDQIINPWLDLTTPKLKINFNSLKFASLTLFLPCK